MANCNENIASVCGTNAGIVAELIDDLITDDLEETVTTGDKKWCRCSVKSMTVYCPFLTVWQAGAAVKSLKKKGIIVASGFNEDPFDHTNWYAFTEYGMRLLKERW